MSNSTRLITGLAGCFRCRCSWNGFVLLSVALNKSKSVGSNLVLDKLSTNQAMCVKTHLLQPNS